MKLDHLSRNTRIWRCLEWVYRCLQSQFTYFRYHSHSASRHLTGAFRSGNSLTSPWNEVGWIPLNTYSYRTVQKSLFISIWFHCWMLNPPEIQPCQISLYDDPTGLNRSTDQPEIHPSKADKVRCCHHADGSHVCRSQNTCADWTVRGAWDLMEVSVGWKHMKQIEKIRDFNGFHHETWE